MEILGLHYFIWLVLLLYFTAMLIIGWRCRRTVQSPEGYLLGNRKFGTKMMIMHAFGAGTNPSDTTGTISKTVSAGASGIWVSWMWMFGTPFYWIIAPVIRRMRCLTMADYFQQRFGPKAAVLYTFTAGIAMTIFFASVLLGTVRTVQGMMGPGFIAPPGVFDWWFYTILLVTTITFTLYGYWGGIVAAIRTDMIQGLMIIALSIIALPVALNYQGLGGLKGVRSILGSASRTQFDPSQPVVQSPHTTACSDTQASNAFDCGTHPPRPSAASNVSNNVSSFYNPNYLNLFDPKGGFSVWMVILLCISAPLTALALPHIMSVCGAGQTEWQGRMGFTCGNMLKRICTIGWSVLGLCWLAYLIKSRSEIHPDAAFGDSIRALLPPVLQGIMLACVMAAAMSSGDAVQVTVAGLFTQSIYRTYINHQADRDQQLRITKITGIIVILISLVLAVLIKESFVASIVAYFRILSFIGIAIAMGILWRRMNTAGVFCCILPAIVVYVAIQLDKQYNFYSIPAYFAAGLPLATGLLGGIVGSLATAAPRQDVIENFFKKIHVPIGQEQKLDWPFEQAVPASQHWFTSGGLFIVKPSRQSWLGFIIVMAVCLACVGIMLAILNF